MRLLAMFILSCGAYGCVITTGPGATNNNTFQPAAGPRRVNTAPPAARPANAAPPAQPVPAAVPVR